MFEKMNTLKIKDFYFLVGLLVFYLVYSILLMSIEIIS